MQPQEDRLYMKYNLAGESLIIKIYMQTKNIVIIASLTIVSLFLGLFWIVAPALMKDKVVGFINSSSADRQCCYSYIDKEA